MNPALGWALAAAFLLLAAWQYGWQGAVFAVSAIVFWLLLQFSRLLRTLRKAAERPIGRVDSAVMLHSQLRPGMRLVDVIAKAGSLGQREREGADDDWRWTDDGGATVRIHLDPKGLLERHVLEREPEGPTPATLESPLSGRAE